MRKFIILIMAITILSYNVVMAQSEPASKVGFRGWGPRIGASINPDQFVFGGHADLGYFGKRIRFEPNLEMGFGDHITLVTVNFDAAYRFLATWNTWSPYVGGGLGVNFYSWDNGYDHGNNNDTEVGVSALGGIERGLSNGSRFFIMAKVGLANSPDIKFLAGWTFFH